MTMTRMGRSADKRTVVLAGVLDAAAVIAFAATGRRSHDEPFDVAGVATTAWPFLAGLALGWLGVRAYRAPTAPLRTGLPIAVITVAVGMVLRLASGQGTALPFVAVASGTMVALLVGWRAISALAGRNGRA